ncbi:MAG: TetR/AcrR family transcriptional regulator [Acidimicrobiales bacterium]
MEAAATLLANGGASALRVRDIAAAAGCSTMGVYSHFGGKDGIVEAIYIDGFQRLTAALREPVAEPAATPALRRWRRLPAVGSKNRGSYSVMFAGAVPGFAPSDAALATAAESFQALQGLVEGPAHGIGQTGQPGGHGLGNLGARTWTGDARTHRADTRSRQSLPRTSSSHRSRPSSPT